ncbi:MAG: hypothetical protein V7686_03240 [Qipengyuania sp.]
MEVVLFLAVIVGAPIVIIGGVQILIWKLVGMRALQICAVLVLLVCGYFLVMEAFAPPVYGNKSGLVGLSTLALGLLALENFLILCAPLMRRFIQWEKSVEARWATDQID